MRKSITFTIFTLFLSLNAPARNVTPVSKQEQVRISCVHNISGFVGDRINLNREKYLKNFPIDEYVDFIVRREHTSWGWTQAEQHGKWIESAYLSAIQSSGQNSGRLVQWKWRTVQIAH